MATKIIMPQGGQHVEEGRVVKWLKAEGDAVKKGEPVCEVETEKVVLEVESPADGVLLKIVVPAGEKVAVFATIGIVGAPGEQVDLSKFGPEEKEEKGVDISEIRKKLAEKEARGEAGVKASGRAKKLAAEKGIDLATLQGSGPGGRIVEEDVLRAVEEMAKAPEEVMVGKVRISPVAKKMAEDKGLDVASIQGTGPMGRIMKEDVLRAVEEKGKKKVPVPGALKQLKETIPIRGVRQVIFDRMHQSLQQSAQLTVTMEVNAGELGRFRKTLVDSLKDQGIRISYNAILVKIIARALEEHPKMNSSVVKDEIWLWDSVNVGVAVDAEQGLIVPVVRDANKKDLIAIQKDIDDKVERAKSKKLVPDDLQGGTFTLTGLGFLDIEAFTPILNPPEVGILGVGKIIEKPVVENGEIKVGQRMSLSLTFDHRIIDGADGARFLKTIKSYIETPYLMQAGKSN
jgi:pyruvate dehydrogenase E2 component (dihydrolipoyllysine-residue acetyltransferase)